MKVRSDYVIISAENILRVFTCNELHGFRTPPTRMVSFFSPRLNSVGDKLKRVPVKNVSGIVAELSETHGFCSFIFIHAVTRRQKSSASQNFTFRMYPADTAAASRCAPPP